MRQFCSLFRSLFRESDRDVRSALHKMKWEEGEDLKEYTESFVALVNSMSSTTRASYSPSEFAKLYVYSFP